MIPAGIAFAEEEVIIIEEPVAAEEVVEEVVEVEPVEVEPVAEEDIAVTDYVPGPKLTWAQIKAEDPQFEVYTFEAVPTCDTSGWYIKNGVRGMISPLGHNVQTILLGRKNGETNWVVANEIDCDDTTIEMYAEFYYCKSVIMDYAPLVKGGTAPVVTCGHVLGYDTAKKEYKTLGTEPLDTTGGDNSESDIGITTGISATALHEAIDAWAAGHLWQKVQVPASCVEPAGYYYKCARCKKALTETEANTVAAALHDDNLLTASSTKHVDIDLGTNSGLLVNSEKLRFVPTGSTLDPNNHYWDTNVRDPLKNDWLAKDATKWNYVEGFYPTCMETGLEQAECKADDACNVTISVTHYIERVADKVDHKMSPTKIVVTEPTCLSNGIEGYACIYGCGKIADAQEMPAKKHSFNRTVDEGYGKVGSGVSDLKVVWTLVGETTNEAAPGTKNYIYRTVCTEPGCNFYIEVVQASATSPIDTTTTDTAMTACANHDPAHIVKIPAIAPTKDAPGYTEGSYCNDCGTVLVNPQYIAPQEAKLEKDKDGNWIYTVGGKQDKDYVGLCRLDAELFFIRNGVVDTSVNGIQQPEKDGAWYFFANGQVQRNHRGFALYDGAWFYINDAGVLDEGATGYYKYDGKLFLVTGGWVRTDYTGMYPESDERTSFRYVSAGMWMEDFTGTVTLDGETWNVKDGVAVR